MKLAALALALAAAQISAATIIVTETAGPADLYKGTKKIGTRPTMAGCEALATAQPAGTYTCRTIATLKTAAPPPAPDMHVGNPADPRTFPAPAAGIFEERVYATTQQPNPSDEGGFRTACTLAQVAAIDPIVLFGQPGKSHLHNFFGNGAMTASSTAETMALGGSTCRGGTVNRSSYWAPIVIDGVTYVVPQSMIAYYKSGSRLPAQHDLRADPARPEDRRRRPAREDRRARRAAPGPASTRAARAPTRRRSPPAPRGTPSGPRSSSRSAGTTATSTARITART